jgi:hypothetical protein
MATNSTAPAKKRTTLTERYQGLRETLEAVENDRERLTEALSNAVLMLRQEDAGWATPGVGAYRGLTLVNLHDWSQKIRASLSGNGDKAPNPHMRNGLMLRHSFIWSGGIHYADVPGDSKTPAKQGKVNVQKIIDSLDNKRLVFGDSARRRRESALFSDGLYLVVGNNKTKKLRPVPLHEVTDTQRSDLYEDEIVAYRWTRNEAERAVKGRDSVLTGKRNEKSYWVYVDWYDGAKPDTIVYQGKPEPVLKDHTAFDLHANRPDGSAYGSPDSISALVYARIIRDLIMNGVKMQDALAMFAFKATATTKTGQQTQALELAKPTNAGSAATMGLGNDLIPLNTAGKGYDFGSIGFVVSTMAASLHISGIALSANTALAGSSYGAAKTLDLPGRMAMETRRAEHIEFDERILRWAGAPDATAYFDNFDDSTDEYRAVQAAMLAWTTGTLSPEGFREELEIIYGRKLSGSIPKGVMIPNNVKSAARTDIDPNGAAFGAQGGGTKQNGSTPAPNQGKSDGTGGAGHANDMKVKPK